MGKAANRRRIAARRNEKPNDYKDRVKLAVKKGEDNLSAMYEWHEAVLSAQEAKHKAELDLKCAEFKDELDLKRAEHEKVRDELKLEKKKLKIRYELKIQKVKNERDDWKTEKTEMLKVLDQSKEWVNLIVTSQLSQNKRNTLLVSKAAHIGIFNAGDFVKISEQLDDDDKCEQLLINPLLDMLNDK